MNYELFYLIRASKESELEKIKNEAEKIVTDNEGVFLEKTTIEKRRLSYIVKHETHGIYIARRFKLDKAENLKEITNKLNLNTEILRFMLSKADELPELKSKEERMSEATQKEATSNLKKELKKEPEKKIRQFEKTEEKKEETKKVAEKEDELEEKEVISTKLESDDIDKKLEEILNI